MQNTILLKNMLLRATCMLLNLFLPLYILCFRIHFHYVCAAGLQRMYAGIETTSSYITLAKAVVSKFILLHIFT